jgi:L-glyceraldehyde 3-phosphate reductase
MSADMLTEQAMGKVRALTEIARGRSQSLAQLALAWALRDERMTSLVIGASSVAQLEANLAAANNLDFSAEELAEIDQYATEGNINLWARATSTPTDQEA